MALQRHDREDLLAEATAMTVRGTWKIDEQEVFIGWRPGGAASIYWNTDPVLQLDADGRIRRCFWRGERIAAAAGRLAWVRAVAGRRVRLDRVPLDEEQCQQLLGEFSSRLASLAAKLQDDARLLGSTEPEPEFRRRCCELLRSLGAPLEIAGRPGVGKRQKTRRTARRG